MNFRVSVGNYRISFKPRGILDTGTSLILAPQYQVQEIAEHLGGTVWSGVIVVRIIYGFLLKVKRKILII